MRYTHYWSVNKVRGSAAMVEAKYQLAIRDCARVIKRYYKENGGLAGYTAHSKLGAYGGINVNGAGENGHETFIMREHFNQNDGGFCKTARKQYDIVVTACLAILKHRLGEHFNLSSDGNSQDWLDGIKLAKQVTGLKIANPISDKRQSA